MRKTCKSIEIDYTQQLKSEINANKDRKSDSKTVCVPGSSKCENRTTGDGMGVRVCGEQKAHKPEEVRMYRKICIKCT